MRNGMECGIAVKSYNDVKVGTRSKCSRRSRWRVPCKGRPATPDARPRISAAGRLPFEPAVSGGGRVGRNGKVYSRTQRIGDQISASWRR